MWLLAAAFAADPPTLAAQLDTLRQAGDASTEALARVGADEEGRFPAAHQLTVEREGVVLGDTLSCEVATWEPLAADCALPFTGDWPVARVQLGSHLHDVDGQTLRLVGLTEATGALTGAPPPSKLLLKLIGTRGESQGTVEDVLADVSGSDLDQAFAELEGIAVETVEREGGGEAAHVGEGAPAPAVARSRTTGSGEIAPPEVREAVEKTLHRTNGQLSYCHERALTSSPGLEGRYTGTFTIDRGRVVGIEVEGADQGLQHCIVNKVRRWRFPDLSAQVTWTWTFEVE